MMKKFIAYPHKFLNISTKVAMAAAVTITIVSGLDYFIKNKEVMRADR
jgi:CDP-diacylglycerol--glycerol-3-phosphate 3-phosphatidyltransferase